MPDPAAARPRRTLRAVRVAEFVRFSVVGCSGIGVNLGAYYGLTRWFSVPMSMASPLAIELSILWNFVLNDRWTFGDRDTERDLRSRIGRFHLVCLAAGAINYLALLALTAAGWWDIAANLAGVLTGAVVKFGVNSSWTWGERAGGSESAGVRLEERSAP